MAFNPDGTIAIYDNPNERFWRVEGDTLIIENENHEVSTKYVSAIKDYYGKWHLEGRFTL